MVVKLAVFSLAYLTLAPLLRAVSYEDLEVLGASLAEMPVLRRPIHMVVAYEKFLASREKSSPGTEK